MAGYMGPYPGNEMFKSFTKTWHSKPYPQISPTRPQLKAAGKVVFITGGGSGIGKAIAIAFAQAGAKAIAIFGRRIDRLKSAADEIRHSSLNGTTVVCEGVDLTQRAAVNTAFASAVNQVGGAKVDVFINNAGVLNPSGTVAGYDEETFYEGIKLNMGSAFNAVNAILPLLAPTAKVFNISSAIAHTDFIPDVWLYSATKAANIKMFDYLQVENPDLHVVNIQPGVVATGINPDFEGQDEGKQRMSCFLRHYDSVFLLRELAD